eukprot:EG_transcript_10846
MAPALYQAIGSGGGRYYEPPGHCGWRRRGRTAALVGVAFLVMLMAVVGRRGGLDQLVAPGVNLVESSPLRARPLSGAPGPLHGSPLTNEAGQGHSLVHVAHDRPTDLVPVKKVAAGATLPVLTAASVIVINPADAAVNPDFFNFQPVCPASDGVFRLGQSLATGLAGDQTVEDYRPLINDVLIRVRTELCVLESFMRETAAPFIAEKGIGWILPLHETSETYVAGVVFMVGANFILLGSTKVVAILAIYADLIVGLPSRLLGNTLGVIGRGPVARIEQDMEKAMAKQSEEIRSLVQRGDSNLDSAMQQVNARYIKILEDLRAQKVAAETSTTGVSRVQTVLRTVAMPLSLYGRVSLSLRQGLELFDTFCSRYFVTFTVGYIIVKTLHFVFFPDLFTAP